MTNIELWHDITSVSCKHIKPSQVLPQQISDVVMGVEANPQPPPLICFLTGGSVLTVAPSIYAFLAIDCPGVSINILYKK